MDALPGCVAITTNESLVEVSPSTVTRLNEPSASSSASCCISDGSIRASVAMNPSIVAMLGRIIPAPLLIPVIVTSTPSIFTRWLKALGTVSVVMMPSAARNQLSGPASARAAGSPASMRSTGKRLHDDAGGKRQYLLGRELELARQGDAGGAGAHQAILAGAGVGVAGVDHHGPDVAARQVLAAHLHRGRAEAVLGEYARDAGARVDQDDGQVAPVGFADAGLGDSDAHARDGMQFARPGRGQIDWHVLALVV